MDWRFIGVSLVVSYIVALLIATALVWLGSIFNLSDPYQLFSWDPLLPYTVRAHRKNR